jgi:hypothetical protein
VAAAICERYKISFHHRAPSSMGHQGLSELLCESKFPGNMQAFEALVQRLSAGSVTTFVGAGASVPLLPTWSKALYGLATQLCEEGRLTSEDHRDISSSISTNPLDAAGDIEEYIGANSFRARLATSFSIDSGECTACHENIISLAPRSIITSNYDDCLTAAYIKKFGKQANVFVSDTEEHIVQWKRFHIENNHTCPILHLHGVSSRPNSMIITMKDYNRFYHNKRNHQFVEDLWRSAVLLVVGFSFSDPFLNIFSQLSVSDLAIESKHFALIGQHEDTSVSSFKRRSFESKYKLVPIFYPVKQGEDHSDLNKILKILVQKNSTPTASFDVPKYQEDGEGDIPVIISSSRAIIVDGLRQDFERNLMAVGENVLYVEPRLMDTPRKAVDDDDNTAQRISIEELARSSESLVIYTPPECGGTALAKRLAYEISKEQDTYVALRMASSLPNYRAKLLREFPSVSAQSRALILDDFDFDRHNRLLKELVSLGIFNRFLLVAKDSSATLNTSVDASTFDLGIELRLVYLWHLSREDIRSLTVQYLNTADTSLVNLAVGKIYDDLLGLCIPLTPTNVLMYLRVIGREQDFQPLNRVHIVERYILDVLQTPQDAFKNAFPAKSKIEIISAFTYHIYTNNQGALTEADWFSFCKLYKDRTLIAFDDKKLLDELLSSRILVEMGSYLCFKYRFFYTYFLCRHVSSKSSVLRKFIDEKEYYRVYSSASVLSSLHTDNAYLVKILCDRLEAVLDEFAEKYVPKDFDPFRNACWARTEAEKEKFWKPIEDQLRKGPSSHGEIDRVKSSLLSELATQNQKVSFADLNVLEERLVMACDCLGQALVNSDEVAGELKLRAAKLVMRSFLVYLQVAAILAPILKQTKYLNWYGVLFINPWFLETGQFQEKDLARFTSGWVGGMGDTLLETIGTRKLGLVFKKLASGEPNDGFLRYLNTICLIRSKPDGWVEEIERIISQMRKDSFYLLKILHGLLDEFELEVNSFSDVQSIKLLIARVHTKRSAGDTGMKAIKRTLFQMEKGKYFNRFTKKPDPSLV